MKKYSILSLLIIFVLLAAMYTPGLAQPRRIGVAATSWALDWLNMLDQGQYEQSWEASSELFKAKTPQEDWIKSIKSFRDEIGALKQRSLASMAYHDPSEDQPLLTCTIYFNSEYERRIITRETILAVYQNDKWKVAGYFANKGGLNEN